MSHIEIHPIPALSDNYIWAIINTAQQAVWLVDPGEAAPVEAYLHRHKLTLRGILITHHHWDHVNGVAALIEAYPVPVIGSINNAFDKLTKRVEHGDTVALATQFPVYTVLAIPGHTLDHIAYYAEGTLFCGDTLFSGGCGRVFEGTPQQLYHSLQQLVALPDDTKIYCAHEYTLANLQFARMVEPSNQRIIERMNHVALLRANHTPTLPSLLADEKETNPFLRCECPTIRDAVQNHVNRSITDPIDVFAALRLWKNTF